jgi:ABC-type transport system involved in multi-copper enzyme maturation permease subunit
MSGLKDLFLEITNILSVGQVRFMLLLRQKLGWMSFLVGVGLVVLSLITAQVSFVNPAKIFWDFGHSVLFVLSSVLSIYLGSQIFIDEKNRRTLHLVLCGGVSRLAWFVGNVLGIWMALLTMLLFWFFLLSLSSLLVFGTYPWVISIQAVALMSLESLIVLQIGFLLSLFVRPMLALVSTSVLVLFLHSLTSLQMIFSDKQVGAYVTAKGVDVFLWFARLMPPLEWFDIKMFIGFEDYFSWSRYLLLVSSALIWVFILTVLNHLRFRKLDL